jgi:hypothetical protein
LNKFALVIIGIVAAMAILIALPSVSQPVAGDLKIDYSKQRLSKIGNDFVVTKVELLSISNDGSATYSETDPRLKILPVEERFTVSGDDYRKLRGLILDTGFIEIPRTDYLQVEEGVDEYTKYRLTVRSGEIQKTFNWVNAYEGTVPYLIETAGSSLDAIAERRP